jgi:predicted GNAT superfamily acetyltransferase
VKASQPDPQDNAYEIRAARSDDVPDIVALQAENQIAKGGWLSVEFPAAWFERAVNDLPVVIARRGSRLAGYLVSSSRAATRGVALSQAKLLAYSAAPDAYNSGPLCIAASERGRGLSKRLFDLQRFLLPGREAVAFIRQDNNASRSVHLQNGFLEVAQFSHNGVDYVVAAYRYSRKD